MTRSTTPAGVISQMARGGGELGDELLEGGGAAGLAARFLADALLRLRDDLGAPVVDDELVSGLGEPDDHVLPHAAQTDHAQLHGNAPSSTGEMFGDCRQCGLARGVPCLRAITPRTRRPAS